MQAMTRKLSPAGLIGLGVLFMWCCSLLFCLSVTDGQGTLRQVLGYAGAGLCCGLAALAVALPELA